MGVEPTGDIARCRPLVLKITRGVLTRVFITLIFRLAERVRSFFYHRDRRIRARIADKHQLVTGNENRCCITTQATDAICRDRIIQIKGLVLGQS